MEILRIFCYIVQAQEHLYKKFFELLKATIFDEIVSCYKVRWTHVKSS